MGVRTVLAGLTLTGGDKTQSQTAPYAEDIAGNLALAQLKCSEAIVLLTRVQTLMTAASDGGNATTVGTQITNLS